MNKNSLMNERILRLNPEIEGDGVISEKIVESGLETPPIIVEIKDRKEHSAENAMLCPKKGLQSMELWSTLLNHHLHCRVDS